MTTWTITFQTSNGLTLQQAQALSNVLDTIDPKATIKSTAPDTPEQFRIFK